MTRRLPIYLALAALALLAFYVATQLQFYEQSVDKGPTAEARRNPYLAAELFLRESGIEVERFGGAGRPDQLPTQAHTLLYLADRSQLTARQSERLLQWAEHGGHLVFVAERLWDETAGRSGDLLLDGLGLQQYQSEAKDAGKGDPHADPGDPEHDPQLTRLFLQGQNRPAYLAFDTDFHLYDAGNRAHAWANSAAATHMLQLRHGQGLVTVLTDAWIWQNDRIAEYDHAWLLAYLTQNTRVTLVQRSEPTGLLDALLRHFPEALLALALLLVLGLWYLARREGPALPAPSPRRRRLQEHLYASAAFVRRRCGERALLETLQHDIAQRATHLQPGFEQLEQTARHQVLAQLSRLPLEAVEQAMRLDDARRRGAVDFTRQVESLQRLRNAL